MLINFLWLKIYWNKEMSFKNYYNFLYLIIDKHEGITPPSSLHLRGVFGWKPCLKKKRVIGLFSCEITCILLLPREGRFLFYYHLNLSIWQFTVLNIFEQFSFLWYIYLNVFNMYCACVHYKNEMHVVFNRK